jgi:hypothetical protein
VAAVISAVAVVMIGESIITSLTDACKLRTQSVASIQLLKKSYMTVGCVLGSHALPALAGITGKLLTIKRAVVAALGQQVAGWSILAHPLLPAAALLMLPAVYKQYGHICPSSLPLR